LVNSNFEYPANPQAPVHPILAKGGRSGKTTSTLLPLVISKLQR
jgi:hypothetical protein